MIATSPVRSTPVDVFGIVVLETDHGPVRLHGRGARLALVLDGWSDAWRWARSRHARKVAGPTQRLACQLDLRLELVIGERIVARREPGRAWRPTWAREALSTPQL